MTSEDLSQRRRRALWRASHRGTKELDLIIGGYAAARLEAMSAEELAVFEAFLVMEETDLQDWLLAPEPVSGVPFAQIINAVRAFHGLKVAV